MDQRYFGGVVVVATLLLCAPMLPAQDASTTADSAATVEIVDTIALPPPSPQPAPTTEPRERANGIDEIVVTAQKREERLQDVPIAIAAFTGEALEASGVKTMADLAIKTPGLVFDTLVNYSLIYIRGVGTDAFIPSADLSVAPYVDGVYFPISFGLARSLGEVERVEVLKGPQGTLFGRNATGGAINIVTKAPKDVFTVSLASTVGNYNENNNRIFVSGPLLEKLSGSFSAIYNRRDDYYDSVAPSAITKLQPYQDVGFNGKLLWTPSDWLDATISGYYFKSRGIGTSLLACIEPSDAGALFGVNCAPDYKTNVNIPDSAHSEFAAGTLTLNVHPGAIDIKSITAYQDTNGQSLVDFDGSSANLVSFGGDSKDKTGEPLLFGEILTQEIQFISNDETWGADRFKWIAGLFYLDGTVGYDPVNFYLAELQGGLGAFLGASAPALASQIEVLSGPLAGLVDFNAKVYGSLDTESYAGFVQGTWTPIDWLDVTLGGRVQSERRKVYNARLDGFATVLRQPAQPQFLEYPDDALDKTDFSPKATVAVKPLEDVMAYVSWQRAFKSGSFNIINLTAPPTRIRSEQVTTVEVGFKSQFFDRSVQVNGAVFENRIADLQSQFVSLLSGGVVQFQNAEKAVTRGIDLDLLWVPFGGLTLNAGATVLDSEYEKFTDAAGYDDNGVFADGNDFSGNKVVRNPELTAVAGFAYSYPIGQGTLDIGADYYYNDGFFFDAQNSLEQDNYELINARLGYFYEPWNLSLAVFGANLQGSRYYIYQFQTDFSVVGKLAPPETYGMRLNWSF